MPRINLTRQNIRRAARLRAMNHQPAIALSAQRIADRRSMYEAASISREFAIATQSRLAIYCCKTGAKIGSIDEAAAASFHADMAPADRDAYANRHIHPAWLNTSPDRLRELQIAMPQHYCIYTWNMLLKRRENARERSVQFARVCAWPIEASIELAELLRRALAMFGRSETAFRDIDASMLLTHDASECIAAVRDALILWIRRAQKAYHGLNADRCRTVTLADIKNAATDIGMPLFREARIASREDNVLLTDLAEIFDTTPASGLSAAFSYRASSPPSPRKRPQYSGAARTATGELAQSLAAAFTHRNGNAPARTQPAGDTTPPVRIKIKLFAASNASAINNAAATTADGDSE